MHYILKMSRYTNIVYVGRYLVLTNIEKSISIVCCFFSYICWSVNCMRWVGKSKKFFWHVRKLRQDLHLRALILFFMESSFLTPWYFFCFPYLVRKLFKGLFQSLCQSVNCMSWVSKFNNFFPTCMETEARFIFDGFNINRYRKFISDASILFAFFIWSANCSRDFSSHFVTK